MPKCHGIRFLLDKVEAVGEIVGCCLNLTIANH